MQYTLKTIHIATSKSRYRSLTNNIDCRYITVNDDCRYITANDD